MRLQVFKGTPTQPTQPGLISSHLFFDPPPEGLSVGSNLRAAMIKPLAGAPKRRIYV
jgi:hypothetical protein